MGRKLTTLILSLTLLAAFGQTRPGSLKGTITEIGFGPLSGASIIVKTEAGTKLIGTASDKKGEYSLNPISPGYYTIEVSFIGLQTIIKKKVPISPNTATLINFEMKSDAEVLGPVIIVHEDPIIRKTGGGIILKKDEMDDQPTRLVVDFATQQGGVQSDGNGGLSVKGTRPEATLYIVDGVKYTRQPNIPPGIVQQVEVLVSGLPAQYGDVQGGVINTTTLGPTENYFGSAELLSSSLFDGYGYNLATFTLGGPLLKKENALPTIGFVFSAEFERNEEQSPSLVPYAGIDQGFLSDLEQNPLRINPSGRSVIYRSEYTNESNLSDEIARRNAHSNQFRALSNLTFRTSKTTLLTLGGRLNYTDRKVANLGNHIFNYKTNLDRTTSDWSARARFQQRFRRDSGSTNLIKNAFYTIQVDYTQISSETKDSRYGTNFFNYGHVGEFDVLTTPSYSYGTDSVTEYDGFLFNGDSPIGVLFSQGNNNSVRGNYTRDYYDLITENPDLRPRTIEELIGNNIPVNGTNPNSVYGLWASPGSSQGNYSKFKNGQFRITASSSFDILGHSIITGFEYEQRNDRSYSLNATGLWTQMRLLQNKPNQDLDLANPILVRDANGVYQDTINYNYAYSPNDASQFAQSVRLASGLDAFSTEQINILNMDPNLFKLDFFSADELINPGGDNYVQYYGYDYTGAQTNDQYRVSDFFTATDKNGNLSRPIGSFQPIYMAGYIQDQFDFRDLSFNVGVRIDRFDLNQEVLKDPYVLFPTYKVKDLASSEISSDFISEVPASIGGDYVVYVSSFDYSTANIVGYRNPSTNQWFDAKGDVLLNPQDLSDAAGGGIKPLLVNSPSGNSNATNTLTAESFSDYKPQVVVMPRISFNFPINDEAIFVAHYDVLSQRPNTSVSRMDPFSYLNLINKDASGILNNPDLKPQVTTEYELGFKQKLTEKSGLKISAYYRELRDMVQTTAFTQAYPITYVAYGNLDFATTKGLIIEYELRRIGNFRFRSNYTLQFADGTGSGINSGAALANSGQPNLRYILPLSNERRHSIMANMDYRFGKKQGPVWFDKNPLENAGINIVMNALSGNPYTKRVDFRDNAQIDGQINGARLPWQVTFDAKINKNFQISKTKSVEIYLQIFNLLNTQNITGVYAFTGSPDDNGFLSSATAQAQIGQQTNAQAYTDLYNRSINNGGNYGLPRRIRLGLSYYF